MQKSNFGWHLKVAAQVIISRISLIFHCTLQKMLIHCIILAHTLPVKKGCHPNHGYNFVNS